MTPEEKARQNIDAQLVACGWVVQDKNAVNLSAACVVGGLEIESLFQNAYS
jgi:type I restriction enzyme R subunit